MYVFTYIQVCTIKYKYVFDLRKKESIRRKKDDLRPIEIKPRDAEEMARIVARLIRIRFGEVLAFLLRIERARQSVRAAARQTRACKGNAQRGLTCPSNRFYIL